MDAPLESDFFHVLGISAFVSILVLMDAPLEFHRLFDQIHLVHVSILVLMDAPLEYYEDMMISRNIA